MTAVILACDADPVFGTLDFQLKFMIKTNKETAKENL